MFIDDAPEVITIDFEGDTRIQLNELQKTVWNKGDLVSVFYHSDANQKWQYQGTDGGRSGDLKRIANASSTTRINKSIVVYPYNDDYWLNTDNYSIEAVLPQTQRYAKDSYGIGANLMVSQSEFTQFTLKSICGWLKLQLTGKGRVVKSINLTGNNNEQVAGLVYIDTDTAHATLATTKEDDDDNGNVGGNLIFDDVIFRSVTLDCGEGVTLSEDVTTFYIALPPQTFEKGITVEVECHGYEPMILNRTTPLTITRNHIQPMASVEHDTAVAIPLNEIHYTATEEIVSIDANAFGVNIISNDFNNATGRGVITFDGDVTSIGYWAFAYTSITSITIPNSVESIEAGAFAYCQDLTNFTIPDSVSIIGESAFSHCTELENIMIPNSVKTIGAFAFQGCRELKSVTIPDSVNTIGDGIFTCCQSMVEFIGKYSSDNGRCLIVDGKLNSFALGCGVTSYIVPSNVTKIGNGAFQYSTTLESITIPNSVTAIDNIAFNGCNNLQSVTMSDNINLSYFGNGVFSGCNNLDIFKGKYAQDNGRILVIDDTLVAFAPAGITHYTIPENVTSIGDSAFASCYNLKNVTIGNGVTTIEGYAFSNCISLVQITIPESVTHIKYGIFSGCSHLKRIYCMPSTPPIMYGRFGGVFSDPDCIIYVQPECVDAYKREWSDYADCIKTYDDAAKQNTKIYYTATESIMPNKLDVFGAKVISNMYDSMTGEGIITFDSQVLTIGDEAFANCTNLTSITLPNSILEIGNSAFLECTNLNSINIPNGVISIGDYAFYHCAVLTDVLIPDSVQTIGNAITLRKLLFLIV